MRLSRMDTKILVADYQLATGETDRNPRRVAKWILDNPKHPLHARCVGDAPNCDIVAVILARYIRNLNERDFRTTLRVKGTR